MLCLDLVNEPKVFFRRHGVKRRTDQATLLRERWYFLRMVETRYRARRPRPTATFRETSKQAEDELRWAKVELRKPADGSILLEGPQADQEAHDELRTVERALSQALSARPLQARARVIEQAASVLQRTLRLSRLVALAYAPVVTRGGTRLLSAWPSPRIRLLWERLRAEEVHLQLAAIGRCPNPRCDVIGGRYFVVTRHEVYCPACRKRFGKYRLWRLTTGRIHYSRPGRPSRQERKVGEAVRRRRLIKFEREIRKLQTPS